MVHILTLETAFVFENVVLLPEFSTGVNMGPEKILGVHTKKH